MSSFRTACPIVDKTTEQFVDFLVIGGERRKIAFEKEVVWIQESETQVQFTHGGRLLREGAMYNDYYGYLSSRGGNSAEVDRLAAAYQIVSTSTVELLLETTIFRTPAYETPEDAKINQELQPGYKRQYTCIPWAWRKEIQSEDGTLFSALERREVARAVTWSSKKTESENAALFEAFAKRWAVPVVADTASA